MHLICCYCNRYIKEKEPIEVTTTTHGICPDCYIPLLKQTDGLSYDDYLETFEVPVVIMDPKRKISAANQAALNMMKKTLDSVLGRRGGEAMECQYSKLPGGCGKTIHCETCTIRNLVLRTMEQRLSHYNEFVSVETEQGKSDFLISTIFNDGFIQIIFEDCFQGNGICLTNI